MDADRRLRAQIAAHTSWALTPDRTARTEPARNAARDRFRDLVDPDGVLPEDVREQAARAAHRAHMLKLARKSAETRRIRKAGRAA